MKMLFPVFLALSLAVSFTPVLASGRGDICIESDEGDLFRDDNVSMDFDDGSFIFTHEDDEKVEITKKYDLIVNGDRVRLSARQQRLVEEYYVTFQAVIDEAKEMGLAGAKIGVQGAKLGLTAVLGVLKLLSPEYDQEDLDADLEVHEEKMEHIAAKLEKRGDKLERKVEKLQHKHERLRDGIEKLDELGWF